MSNLHLLFDAIENTDLSGYRSLLFNIYTDKDYYTAEACFDDEAFIIGRDNPFVICERSVPWEKVESDMGSKIKVSIKEHEETYKHFESISYGFVDGDLHYIRKPKKTEKQSVRYTSDDFKNFESHKLTAWLSVYLTDEAKEKYKFDMMKLMFTELTEEQHKYWREILADNFDYEKCRE